MPAFAELCDDFEDNSLDYGIWHDIYTGSGFDPPPETGGQLHLEGWTLKPVGWDTTGWTLRDSKFTVQFAAFPATDFVVFNIFALDFGDSVSGILDQVDVTAQDGGDIEATLFGTASDPSWSVTWTDTFDPVAHATWQVRDTDGGVQFLVGPDPCNLTVVLTAPNLRGSASQGLYPFWDETAGPAFEDWVLERVGMCGLSCGAGYVYILT
jgi:hypothetical protein